MTKYNLVYKTDLTYSTTTVYRRQVDVHRNVYATIDGTDIRVHRSVLTPTLKNYLIPEPTDEIAFIQAINFLLSEEDAAKREGLPTLAETEALLRSMMILDSGIYELFISSVPEADQSYLAWKHVADDGDWYQSSKPALKKMPTRHMTRYFFAEMADNTNSAGLEGRLKVLSKYRDDEFGNPVNWLRKALGR